jgi:glycine C-acetyltransferase
VVPLQKMVNALYEAGIHTNGVCYPVVPQGQARIRLDVTAQHSEHDVARTVAAFEKAARALGGPRFPVTP